MILIVDDKEENIYSLKALLQLHLFAVDTAASGEEALTKVLKHEYALIILDVQMPGMDGYEVAEAITGFSKTRNIPIIFLSAVNIDKRFITKGYASGGVDYVTKPFDPDLLMLKVQTFYKLHIQAKELKRVGKALEEANQNLEAKIQARTAELTEMNKELEKNNVELQQYASVASHDLQEPLRKIITFTNVIRERYIEPDSEASRYIGKVVSSAQRMRNLITDLLSYSKLSSTSHFEMTDLEEILMQTLSDLELTISEKNARISVGHIPSAEVIPGQIRQVFQNILSNAMKFCKDGFPPSIEITAELIQDKDLHAPADAKGNFLRIIISDNGIGFSTEYVNKIFGLFQRLHNREEFEGTGIGLAIVKKIIEKHKGLIEADGVEGNGATFTIVLPVRQNLAELNIQESFSGKSYL